MKKPEEEVEDRGEVAVLLEVTERAPRRRHASRYYYR